MERPTNQAAVNTTSTAAPPTTYVQADAHTFRDLVQRLTGAPSRPAAAVGPRRQPFKLHDRRGSSVRNLEIQLGLTSLRSPRSTTSKSPIPSPVTPLVSHPVFSPPASEEEERRVVVEKGFYLHPSPVNTPRGAEPPELLPLFPLCSPRQQQESSKSEKE